MTTKTEKKPVKSILIMLYLCGLSLLIYLGGWQLTRGLEKAGLELQTTSDNAQIDLGQRPDDWSALNYQRVRLKGTWMMNKTFLMDNRIHKGMPGYEVLTPFQLGSTNTIVLVNRGWISDNDIGRLEKDSGIDNATISGQIYQPSKGFTLGQAYTDPVSWPLIVQYFDKQAFSEKLKTPIEPAVLVQTESESSYVRLWKPYVINPEKHYGYAAQWWGLALVMIVFGFIWNRKRSPLLPAK